MGVAAIAAIGALASAGAGVYGASQSSKGAKKVAHAGKKAAYQLQNIINALAGGNGLFGLPSRAFSGSKPEIPGYERVNLANESARAIEGNVGNLPNAARLSAITNSINTALDSARAEQLSPGFLQGLAQAGSAGRQLASGYLPVGDVMQVARNRAQAASALGLAGTQYRSALPRDLGLTRLQAIQQGGNLLSQTAATMGQINPISAQLRTQQFLNSPQEQADMTFRQNLLDQQLAGQRALIAASPDPLATLLLGTEKDRLGLYSGAGVAGGQAQQATGQAWMGAGSAIGAGFNNLAGILQQRQNASLYERMNRQVVQPEIVY